VNSSWRLSRQQLSSSAVL